jgi:hypothetical protein
MYHLSNHGKMLSILLSSLQTTLSLTSWWSKLYSPCKRIQKFGKTTKNSIKVLILVKFSCHPWQIWYPSKNRLQPVATGFFNSPHWGNCNWQLEKTGKTATDGPVFFQLGSVQLRFFCSYINWT